MTLDVNATITVQSYVCNDTNTIIDEPVFSPGRYFCICVGPEYDEDINYSVSGFKSMICSNNGKSRNLVRNYITDPLTDIDDGADGNGIHAIQSMVISGFIDDGDSKFTCEGLVMLEYYSNGSSSTKQGSRHTQERQRHTRVLSDQQETNSFKVEVELLPFRDKVAGGKGLYLIFYLIIVFLILLALGLCLILSLCKHAPTTADNDGDDNNNPKGKEGITSSSLVNSEDEEYNHIIVPTTLF